MNADIWTYMADHGIDLKESGSAERGFCKREALALLKMLEERHIKPLGLEVWHQQKDGRFEMDALAGWVPASLANDVDLFAEVREIIESSKINEQTIFTLQF